MSLKELARLSGVSISTASKAFSGSREISDSTRNTVFEKAKELGLYEKYIKDKPQKCTIGLLCPEICSEYYARILDKLIRCLKSRDAFPVICVSGFDEAEINDCFNRLAYIQNVDGVINISGTKLKNHDKFPVITLGNISGCDIKNGIFSAVRHLADNGHQRIAFIGEKNTSTKFDCFVAALKANNLHFDRRLSYNGTERFEAAGSAGIEALINDHQNNGTPLPTAIICAYDYIAIGAIDAIKKHNLSVPEDISIIGMDNIYASAKLDTPLTSISVFSEENCEAAVDMIMKKISNNYITVKVENPVTSTLITRNSVKNIN